MSVLLRFACASRLGWGILFCTLLASCMMAEKQVPAPLPIPANTRPTSLTVAATAALQQAEQAVNEARQKQRLWISAISALQKAQAYAQEFDSEMTLKFAQQTAELCVRSANQQDYPVLNLTQETTK